jgi:hypothetical protein
MNGRQRIPQLRVEFIDERAGADAGVAEPRAFDRRAAGAHRLGGVQGRRPTS